MAWNRIQGMVIKPQKVVLDYDFHNDIYMYSIFHHHPLVGL